jgi:hypothetical protein
MSSPIARHLIGVHATSAAILVAATALWFLAGVRPLMSAKQRASELGGLASDRRATIRELVGMRDASATRLAGVEQELSDLTVRLRPPAALNAQLAELAKLAEAEHIIVERIEPSTMVETALAIRVPVRISGRGSSPSAVRFLAALRSRFPDIAVESFDVAVEMGDTDAAIRFDCVWYADRSADRPKSAAIEP